MSIGSLAGVVQYGKCPSRYQGGARPAATSVDEARCNFTWAIDKATRCRVPRFSVTFAPGPKLAKPVVGNRSWVAGRDLRGSATEGDVGPVFGPLEHREGGRA
jgi:hypothetical protein